MVEQLFRKQWIVSSILTSGSEWHKKMQNRRLKIERLARKEEKTIIRRIVILSFVSLVMAIFIFTVGISLLGKFTDLLGLVFVGKQDTDSQSFSIQPPVLDELPQATNSSRLDVKGFISSGEKVEIYLDGEKDGDATVDGSKFEYSDLVLKDGENKISAKVIIGENTSDESEIAEVILDKTDPKLEIESPADGQTITGNNRIAVVGQTDKDAQVYANGFLASVDFDGKFEVFVPVSEGESTIEIKAIDSAGNVKIEQRKVTFRKS